MKKFLAILLCALTVVSALSFTACKDKDGNGKEVAEINGKNPSQLYSEILEKVQKMDNFTATATQLISVSAEGINQTQEQVVISKVDGHDMYSKIDSEAAPTLNGETWYVDNVVYTNQGGVNGKATIPYDEFMQKFAPQGSSGSGLLMNIPDSWLKDLKFQKESADSYYLSFTVSGDDFQKYFEDSPLIATIENYESMNMSIKDITYKVCFDGKGELGDIIVSFDIGMEVQGVEVKTTVTSTTVLTDLGSTKITAPEGGDTWTDVTGQI